MSHPKRSRTYSLKQSAGILFRMWNYCRQYRLRFYAGFIIGCFSPLFFAYMDAYILQAFSEVCVEQSFDSLFGTLLRVSVIELAGFVVFPMAFGTIYTTYSLISGAIKKDMFDKAQKLPVSYIERTYSGDLVSRLTSDFDSAIQLVAYPGVGQDNPFALVLMIVAVGIIVIAANPLLGVLSLLFSFLGILMIQLCMKPLQKKEHQVKAATGEAAQGIINSLSGTMVSRMYGLDLMLQEQYEEKTEDIYRYNVSLIRRKSILFLFMDFQSFLSFAGVTAIGFYLSYRGMVDIPTVIFIASLQMHMSAQVSELGQKYAGLQRYIVGADRLFAFLDAEPEIERQNLAQADWKSPYAVEMEHISFAYEEGQEIFEDFSIQIRQGEKLAIVGGSGGGKSTMYKLLLEFANKSGGDIRIFGNSSTEYSVHTMRSFFSYVPQDCYLFDTTIYENVKMGRPDATQDEIERALEDAFLTDFIKTLPNGMYTEVGERGSKLSGGQKQRIAIARAFLKNAPIILLDEATSALDSKSEQEVQEALDHLLEGRTGVIIAHRLSTIENCDRIIVLEKGRVAEEGTHQELLTLNGRYKQLFEYGL